MARGSPAGDRGHPRRADRRAGTRQRRRPRPAPAGRRHHGRLARHLRPRHPAPRPRPLVNARAARATALARRVVGAVRRRLRREGTVDGVLLALGATTGLVTGLLAFVLITAVELLQHLVWSDPAPAWQLVAVPTIGGLVVGLLVSRVAPEAAGGGVVATMETLALRGGRFRRRVVGGGMAATTVALSTGASGGREGPIVLIGGAVGSWLSRLVPLDEPRTRALVGAGAAAGIGASFNAPVGGMLFAIEVLQIGMRSAALQVVVIGSVVGSVTARQLVGPGLIFQPRRDLGLGDPQELLVYVALGLLAVGVAVAFHRAEEVGRRVARYLREHVGRTLTVGIGGLAVGLMALGIPEVLGDGDELPPIPGTREPIQAILDVEAGTSWWVAGTLLLLLAAKIVATTISVTSGSAVGTFAPLLLTGAALGGAVGIVAVRLLPDLDPGAVATVGMAAVFAATARAPLTAILIVFELVGDYGLVLPLMTAVGLATFLADRVLPDGIYTAQLRQRGVVLGRPDDVDVLQLVTAGEVMTANHPTVHADESREELVRRFEDAASHGYAVVDDAGRLVGVLTRGDLARDGGDAAALCTRRALTVAPDDAVFLAVRRMASLDVGRVPVVDPGSQQVVGMLRRQDVVRAYQRGLSRGAGAQQRRAAGALRDLTGVRFVELVVGPDSPVADLEVRDVGWPERTVLTSIRRDGDVLLPTGDTSLHPGDVLVVLTARADEVRSLLAGAAAED
ncbi:CBS domain-containing protein [Nitriliruptoraceae bacterium ZYF776]|nr:CBS domain-containing protein [Profundirhabdus halotolerans]